MSKNGLLVWSVLGLLGLITACSQGEIVTGLDGQSGTPAAVDLVALAETAEAQTTSTAFVDYSARAGEARKQWEAAGIESYRLQLTYNEGRGAMQAIRLVVEDGEVIELKHDCFPAEICFKVPIEKSTFTVPGIFNLIDELAAQKIPLAILRFDEAYGYPAAITTNSDLAPILRQVNIESFEILE